MSLSTGTRNLKFMQRAAARNSLNASTSAAGSGSNTPQRSATPSAGTPGASATTPARANNAFGALEGVADDGVSTPSGSTSRSGPQVDSEGVQLSKEEKAAMWVLPTRPARPTSSASAGRDVGQSQAGPSSGRRFVFERSYMPFMVDSSAAQTDEAEEEHDQDGATHKTYMDNTSHTATAAAGSTSTTAGGGRMAFGNFGQAAKDAEMPAGDAYGSDDDDAETSTRKVHGRAGYMQNDAQGARGKKRGSDTQGDYRGQSNGYERDRDESRQAKIRKMAQDRARQQPKPDKPAAGFMRPSNYDSSLATSSDSKPRIPVADKLRSIASARPVASTTNARNIKPDPRTGSSSSSAQAGGSNSHKSAKRTSLNNNGAREAGNKRVEVEKASESALAALTPGAGSNMNIDERERQLKAQKKKEKKARRQAKD